MFLIKQLCTPELNPRERVAMTEALCGIVLKERVKDDPATFAKDVLEAIKRLDPEGAIESFKPTEAVLETASFVIFKDYG